MGIRITGTEPDTRATAALIGQVLTIHQPARFRRNRNSITGEGRLYLDADLPTPSTVEAIRNEHC